MLECVIISDVHVGSARCSLKQVAQILDSVGPSRRMIIAGDLLDAWLTSDWSRYGIYGTFARRSEETPIVIRGNHDPDNLSELVYWANVVDSTQVETASGPYKVIHGHEYDDLLREYSTWCRLLYFLHIALYRVTRLDFQRLARFSLAAYSRAKYFRSFVDESLHAMAVDFKDYKGVILGHTHYPIRIQRAGFEYINCGDMVGSNSVVTVDADGRLALRQYSLEWLM